MMKKSQILAALALAMALGVVAPVVSAENASAVTEATQTADGSATVAEAGKFKASVEGSKQYKALAALEAVKTITGDNANEDKVAAAIATEYNKVVPAKDALDTTEGKVTLNEAVSFATKLDKYSAYAQAVHAIANAVKNGEAATFNSLKTAYKGITDEEYTGADYTNKASLTALQKAVTGTANYAKWFTLVVATDSGVELQQAIKDLKATLTTVNSDVQIVRNLSEMTTYTQLTAAKAAVMRSEQGTAYTALKNFFDGDFKTLKDATEADRKATYNELNGEVNNVEKLYNKADNSLTVSAIVAGYVAPVNPAEPGDGKDDVNAPPTGIAGTAEGTATTVSIVAGLATALTALGAGVVAYRSARRK